MTVGTLGAMSVSIVLALSGRLPVSIVGTNRYRATWRAGQWVVLDTLTVQIIKWCGSVPTVSRDIAQSLARRLNEQG